MHINSTAFWRVMLSSYYIHARAKGYENENSMTYHTRHIERVRHVEGTKVLPLLHLGFLCHQTIDG